MTVNLKDYCDFIHTLPNIGGYTTEYNRGVTQEDYDNNVELTVVSVELVVDQSQLDLTDLNDKYNEWLTAQ